MKTTSSPIVAVPPAPAPSHGEDPCPARAVGKKDLPFRALSRVDHVVVPLDFSENSLVALRYAVRFAREFHTRLTLLHIVEGIAPQLESGAYDLRSTAQIELAEKRMAALAQDFAAEIERGLIATVVRVGMTAAQLCQEAWDLEADLLIVSTHGHSSLKDLLFGGITTALIRRAPCPVLVVRAEEEAARVQRRTTTPLHRRFLVPVDFSPRSEHAILAAAKLAARCHGEVSLLHVIEPSVIDEDIAAIGAHFEAYSADANSRLRSVGERTLREPVRGSICVRRGLPFAQIIAEAHNADSDLLVLTTHGRSGLAHLFMGSTAERIVRHAPCPALIIRAGGT